MTADDRLPGLQPGLFISAGDDPASDPPSGGIPVAGSGAEAFAQDRASLALELGEAEERIGVVRPNWQALTRRVVVVDLSIGYYRSRHRLTAEDLGLTEAQRRDPEYAEALHDAVTLGNKRLVTDFISRAEEVEGQGRYALEQHSVKSGFGHLVPREVYPRLRERLEQLRDEFFQIRDELQARYPELAPDILTRFRRIGRGALAQQRAAGLRVQDEDTWIEDYARRHLALLPPCEVIAASFTFEWTPSYLAISSEIVEDEALAQKRRLEAQVEAELLRLEAQNIRYQEDFAYEQKRLELEAIRRDRQREEQLAAEIAQARRQKQLELVDSTFSGISAQLREAVYGVCLDVLDSMKDKGRVVRNSSRQLRGLADKLRMLNVCADAELDAIAGQLEAIVRSNAKRRDSRAISEVLAEIGTLTRAQLVAAGRTPRSGLSVAIPDQVDASRRTAAARRISGAPVSFEVPVIRPRTGRISTGVMPLALAS